MTTDPTPRASLPLTHDPLAYSLTLPPKYRGVYLKAVSGSRPAARKAMCFECMGWAEGAVKSIRLCPCCACPNHAVRPYQSDEEKGQRVQAKETGAGEPVTPRAADPSRIERLKRAREARKQRQGGWTGLESVMLLFIIGALFFLAFNFPWSRLAEIGEIRGDRCPPVSSPTGQLLCYSGGILVYQTDTYRNGGVLCSSSGVEIKTIPGNSTAFCIEESRQESMWDPPPPSREAER